LNKIKTIQKTISTALFKANSCVALQKENSTKHIGKIMKQAQNKHIEVLFMYNTLENLV